MIKTVSEDYYVIVAFNEVIEGVNKGNTSTEFVAIDRDSGGYPYFTRIFSMAKIFDSLDEARVFYNDQFDKDERNEYSDGSEQMASLLRSAGKICNNATKSKCQISILKLEFVQTHLSANFEIQDFKK
jgi:hypothetical protein